MLTKNHLDLHHQIQSVKEVGPHLKMTIGVEANMIEVIDTIELIDKISCTNRKIAEEDGSTTNIEIMIGVDTIEDSTKDETITGQRGKIYYITRNTINIRYRL